MRPRRIRVSAPPRRGSGVTAPGFRGRLRPARLAARADRAPRPALGRSRSIALPSNAAEGWVNVRGPSRRCKLHWVWVPWVLAPGEVQRQGRAGPRGAALPWKCCPSCTRLQPLPGVASYTGGPRAAAAPSPKSQCMQRGMQQCGFPGRRGRALARGGRRMGAATWRGGRALKWGWPGAQRRLHHQRLLPLGWLQ
jgi:hypothetical protein